MHFNWGHLQYGSKNQHPCLLMGRIFLSCYIFINWCSARVLAKCMPYEKLTQHKPNISHLWVIGFTTHIWIPEEHRHKLVGKSIKAILVGYDNESKAYRYYNPNDQKIYISKNVEFDESPILFPSVNDSIDGHIDSTFLEGLQPKLLHLGNSFVSIPLVHAQIDTPSSTTIHQHSQPVDHPYNHGPSSPPADDVEFIIDDQPLIVNQLDSPTLVPPPWRPWIPMVVPIDNLGPKLRRPPPYLKDYYHNSYLTQ